MGLFDKFLKSLGFEDEEEKEEKEPKPKKNIKEKKHNKVSATFNLNEDESITKTQNQINELQNKIGENIKEETLEFELIKVKSQIDVQEVICKLRQGKSVLINLENLNETDVIRSLDFLTGAVFALELKMQKVDENMYLIK